MINITKYHIDAYNKFLNEYSTKHGKNCDLVDKNEVDYYKAKDIYFPQIEVHLKDGRVFTVNRIDENEIAWVEGIFQSPQL